MAVCIEGLGSGANRGCRVHLVMDKWFKQEVPSPSEKRNLAIFHRRTLNLNESRAQVVHIRNVWKSFYINIH
jgi:hypothetical protein